MRPMLRLLAPAALALSIAGCSERPFVDATPQALAELKAGSSFSICHAPEHTRPQIDAIAEQTCQEHGGLHAEFTSKARYSCRLLAPQRSSYKCK